MGKKSRFEKYWEIITCRIKSPLDVMIPIFECIGICLCIAYLFYKSWWALILFPISFPPYFTYRSKKREEKRKSQLRYQFKEMLVSVSTALSAGYSMENALIEAQKELYSLLGKDAIIVDQLTKINGRIRLKEPTEKVLMDFGKETRIDDIVNFSQIFSYAKRSGGNYIQIIKNTATSIQEKIEVEREIETIIASKKMESRIMYIVPIGIIVYLTISSPDFLSPLYGNLLGVIVMSLCLIIYIISVLMGEKIMDIHV